MSNLSDLLPAGASGKTIEAVATATIASKAPVILNSAGTVTEVGGVTGSAGTPVAFGSVGTPDYVNAAYDTSANKVVVTFMDYGVSQYGYAVVGTVSGTAISWGTPVVFNSGESIDNRIAYDSDASKVVVAYRDGSAGNYGKAVVGTVSGTSISFGTEVDFNAASTTNIGIGFDSTANKAVIAFRDDGNSDYGTAVVGTVSGTSISFGSEAVFQTNQTSSHNLAYDPDENKMVLVYKHDGNSSYGTSNVCTITGTSIAFGTDAIFKTANTDNTTVSYDTSANKMVIPYAISGKGNAVVGTVSGTSISFGAEAEFNDGGSSNLACAYDSTGDITVVSYTEAVTTFDGFAAAGTVSGTSISFASALNFTGDVTYSSNGRNTIYDPDENKMVSAYRPGFGAVYTPTTENLTATNFVGIADAAITSDATFVVTVGGGKFVIDGVSQDTVSLQEGATYTFDQAAGTNSTHPLRFSTTSDGTHGGGSEYTTGVTTNGTPGSAGAYTRIVVADSAPTLYYYCSAHSGMGGTANTPAFSATGTVVVQGGTVTGANTILPQTMSFGSEAVYESAASTYNSAAFDSDSNRVVIAYTDGGNSDNGTAVVGTVSGTSISWGTPVVFDGSPHGAFYNSATFDSNSNKVVIAYQDAGNSMHGTSIIGTVSGTSISFGTPVIFEAAEVYDISTSFDSTANKVVIAYRDAGNSMYGTAIVGTVSGTSISYGTAVVFESAESKWITSTYDANADRTVIAYMDDPNSDYGTAIVGTVSGTAISFGTAVVFNAAESTYLSSTYDSTAQKVVISYMDGGSSPSNKGTAIVGTVSGTTISFGTEVIFNAASSNYMGMTYDANANQVVIAYQETSKGYALTGTVSGTTVSFDTPVVFNNIDTSNISPVYNSTDNKIVIAYTDTGNSNYGTGIVGTFGDDTFTVGSKYYVTPAGSYSTVAGTPSVNAGLATSTTQLLLNGDS